MTFGAGERLVLRDKKYTPLYVLLMHLMQNTQHMMDLDENMNGCNRVNHLKQIKELSDTRLSHLSKLHMCTHS